MIAGSVLDMHAVSVRLRQRYGCNSHRLFMQQNSKAREAGCNPVMKMWWFDSALLHSLMYHVYKEFFCRRGIDKLKTPAMIA